VNVYVRLQAHFAGAACNVGLAGDPQRRGRDPRPPVSSTDAVTVADCEGRIHPAGMNTDVIRGPAIARSVHARFGRRADRRAGVRADVVAVAGHAGGLSSVRQGAVCRDVARSQRWALAVAGPHTSQERRSRLSLRD